MRKLTALPEGLASFADSMFGQIARFAGIGVRQIARVVQEWQLPASSMLYSLTSHVCLGLQQLRIVALQLCVHDFSVCCGVHRSAQASPQ